MSRSIHATRHDLRELLLFDFADANQQQKQVRAVQAARRLKRRVKSMITAQRQAQVPPGSSPGSSETLRIHVRDVGPFVQFPASPSDLRGVLARLPRSVLDNLGEIELCLGRLEQGETGSRRQWDRDPLVGRHGDQLLTGVYLGPVLGSYSPDPARIRLYAYVYDPRLVADLDLWNCYLRLHMLSTFVHEVAHHFDHRRRVARGRWRADNRTRTELYAREYEWAWLQEHVVEYVEQTYPVEAARLTSWIADHGGTNIPLGRLISDPRTLDRDGKVTFVLGDVESAIKELVDHVASQHDAVRTRVDFAERLHWAEQDDLSLQVVQQVLSESAEDSDGWSLLACLHRCGGRFVDARAAAERAVALDPNARAWPTLASVCAAQGDWTGLLDASGRWLQLAGGHPQERWRALMHQARAHIELGRWDATEAVVQELASLKPPSRRLKHELDRLRTELAARALAAEIAGTAE